MLAAILALPSEAAGGWSRTRDIGGAQYIQAPAIGFNSSGLAVAAGSASGRPYIVRRRPGRDFSNIRFLKSPPTSSYAPVLDPDGGGVLFGTYLDFAPEESDVRDDCCDRVSFMRLAPAGRVGRVEKLSPHAERPFGIRLNEDRRGGAGATWSTDGRWFTTTRRRGGGFAAPREVEAPDGLTTTFEGNMVTRPSGWTFAAWAHGAHEVRLAHRRPGRDFGEPYVWRLDPSSSLQVGSVRLEVGRRGHAWVVWSLEGKEYAPRKSRIVAAPRRGDGSLGPARTILRSTELFYTDPAVDDRGGLHVAAFARRQLNLASLAANGRLEGVRRIASGPEAMFALDAGGDGHAVVAWRAGSRVYARDRLRGGRLAGTRRLDGGGPDFGMAPRVAVGPRRESIVTWARSTRNFARTDVRYAVLTR